MYIRNLLHLPSIHYAGANRLFVRGLLTGWILILRSPFTLIYPVSFYHVIQKCRQAYRLYKQHAKSLASPPLLLQQVWAVQVGLNWV